MKKLMMILITAILFFNNISSAFADNGRVTLDLDNYYKCTAVQDYSARLHYTGWIKANKGKQMSQGGKYYFEIKIQPPTSHSYLYYVAVKGSNGVLGDIDDETYGWFPMNGEKRINGTHENYSSGGGYQTGFKLDLNNRTISAVSSSGVDLGVICYLPEDDQIYYPYIACLHNNSRENSFTINFGESEFLLGLPEGYLPYDTYGLFLPSPENIIVEEKGLNYIKISWDSVEGAQGYYLYLNGEKIDSIDELEYIYFNLDPDTEYSFHLQAFEIIDGEEFPGVISEEIIVKTAEKEPLQAPVISVTETSMDYITISWPPITGAVQYKIYRNGHMIDTIAGTSYTYGGLLPYTYYTLSVRGVEFFNGQYLDGKLAELTAATDVVPDLPEPEDFIVTEKTMFSITTAWEPVEDASGYFVYKNGIKIGSTQEPEYSFVNLQPGTEYTLEVEAYRVIGGVVYGGEKAELIESTNDLSGGVTYLWLVSKSDDGATIAWTGIESATGYRIYRDDSLLTQVAGTKTQYEAQGLERGRAYYFYITSIVDGVESEPSNVVEVRTQLPIYDSSLSAIIGRITTVARSMSSGFKLALAVIISGKVILFVMYLFRRLGARM